MNYFGIDIGCTAIKFGEVEFGKEIKTIDFDMKLIPQTQRTEKYTEALLELISSAKNYKGIGIGFPSVVWEHGIMNLDIQFDDIWQKVDSILREKQVPHFALNDADAAGFAELYNPGAAEYRRGVTVVLTLGTGIGFTARQSDLARLGCPLAGGHQSDRDHSFTRSHFIGRRHQFRF